MLQYSVAGSFLAVVYRMICSNLRLDGDMNTVMSFALTAIPTYECHVPLVLKMVPKERKETKAEVSQNQVKIKYHTKIQVFYCALILSEKRRCSVAVTAIHKGHPPPLLLSLACDTLLQRKPLGYHYCKIVNRTYQENFEMVSRGGSVTWFRRLNPRLPRHIGRPRLAMPSAALCLVLGIAMYRWTWQCRQ